MSEFTKTNRQNVKREKFENLARELSVYNNMAKSEMQSIKNTA